MGVGEALAAAREAAGLSVDDVSRATRIRGELIRKIEAGDFAACGGAVYARGHIRAIAGYVGADPAPLVAEFDKAHGGDELPAAREIFEHEVIAMPERTGPNWTAAMAVVAAILFLVAIGSLFNSDKGGTPVEAKTLTSPTPSATAPATPSPAQSTGPLAGQVQGTGVYLRVTLTSSRSYVTVRADGKTVFQGLLTAPAQRDFSAKHAIHLVVGNAAAVHLVVNGHDLGSPGRPGEVVRLDFGPGDPTAAG